MEVRLDRPNYSVDEDRTATVCASLQNIQNIESGRSFAVTFRTVSGSE